MDVKTYSAHVAVAVRSPRRIVLHPQFWARHFEYLAILSGAAALICTLFIVQPPRVPRGLLGEPAHVVLVYLLGAVFLLLICGVSLRAVSTATAALGEAMVDSSIAAVIENDADKELEELQRIPGSRIDFGTLRRMLPANSTKPEPAMIRIALELLKEARNLRFDSRYNLLQRYRTESATYVHRLERLQKYALRLGILGTFVGLMFALTNFETILPPSILDSAHASTSAQSVLFSTGSRHLLNSLIFSFGTSIAGLMASLFIAAQAELVRRRQLRCTRYMEDASLSLVTLAGRTIHREDLLSSLEDNTRAMKELQAQVYHQTQQLEEALAGLGQRITDQTTEIEAGMVRLTEARERLDNFLKQVEDSHERFLGDLTLSLEKLIQRLQGALGGLGEGLASELRTRAKEIVTKFDDLLQRIGSSHEGFLSDLTDLFEEASLDQLVERLPASVTGLGERLANDVGSGFVQLGRKLEGLRDTVAAVERDLAAASQDLAGKTSSLQSSVQSIDSQITAAAEESRRTLREVPPALQSLRKKLENAKAGGLVTLDVTVFKRVLLGSTLGLLLGIPFSSTPVSLAGALVGPFLLLTIFGSGGGR